MDKAAKKTAKRNRNIMLFLCALCVISNLSYYPTFVKGGVGRQVATAVWLVLGIFILLRMKIKFPNTRAFMAYTVLLIFFVLNTGVVTMATGENAFRNHFFQLVMIASAIFVCAGSLQKDISPDRIRTICRAYYDTMALISVPLFIFYLRGSNLSSRQYSYKYGKNEIAVLLLAAVIIACTVYKPKGKFQRLFQIASIAFMTVDIIYLRCRSVLLGGALLIVMLIFSAKKMNRTLRIILIIVIIAVVILFMVRQDLFNKFVDDIIFAGRDSSDSNDLTSGRNRQVSNGMKVFSENPLTGVGKYHRTLDNFYVSALVNYGLLSWPLLLMAVLPFIWSLVKLKQKTDLHICFFILSASLVMVATLEELAPFGPGTRCYLLWLMWGLMVGRDIPAEDAAAKVQAAEEEAKDGKTPEKIPAPVA